MDLNICKHKCRNNCYFDSLFEKDGKWFIYLKDMINGYESTSIPIEKPLTKTLKFLYKSESSETYKEYKFVRYHYEDYAYVPMDYIIRGIHMCKNDLCPYYVEHLLKDVEHNRRVKEDRKLRKKKKEIRKLKNGI